MEFKSNNKPEDDLSFAQFNQPNLARLQAAPDHVLVAMTRAKLAGAVFVVNDGGVISESDVKTAEGLPLETTHAIRRYLASLVDAKKGMYGLPHSFFFGQREGDPEDERPATRPERKDYPDEFAFTRAEAQWARSEQMRKDRIEAARSVR